MSNKENYQKGDSKMTSSWFECPHCDEYYLTEQPLSTHITIKHQIKERKSLRKFASKITKVPETVRVYPPSIMKKERERRE